MRRGTSSVITVVWGTTRADSAPFEVCKVDLGSTHSPSRLWAAGREPRWCRPLSLDSPADLTEVTAAS